MAVNKSFNGTTYSIPTTAGENGWTNLTNFLQALADYAAVKTTTVQAIRTATTSPITVSATSDFGINVALSVAGVSTVTLPVGASGQMFCIIDGNGDSATYNITVQGSSSQTINGASTYTMASNKQVAIFQFNGTEWKVIAEYLGASINATKIGAGSVDNTEFAYLNGVTSAIQTQLNTGATNLTNHEADTSTHGVGEIVGRTETQTLTNKTINTASNTVGPLDNISGTLSVSKGGTGLTAVGSALQVLRTNAGATALEFASVGSGDVVGPASSTDNAIARFDGTTGKLVQNSGATINDSNNMSAASYTATGGTAANNTMYVASNVLRFRGGTSGLGFNNSSGTEVASVTGAGAWTLGNTSFGSATQQTIYGYGTGGANALVIRNLATVSGGDIIDIQTAATSGTVSAFTMTDGAGTLCGYCTIDTAANTVSYVNTSDGRLKHLFEDFNGLGLITQMKPWQYERKTQEGVKEIGFVAQEMESVFPQAVTTATDEFQTMGIDYSKFTPVLVKALQELKAELDVAKARIEALESGN